MVTAVKLLCITDPLTHPSTDTTPEVYNRLAVDPRFDLFHLDAHGVGREPEVPVSRITGPLTYPEFRAISNRPVEGARFGDFDLVWSRTDKPFPSGFLDGLIRHEQNTRFVARPSSQLECDHRGFYRARASQFMPPGIVTRRIDEAAGFIRSTGTAVAKRNRSYGGKGVSRIWCQGARWRIQTGAGMTSEYDTLEEVLEALFATDSEPYEFVQYQKNVSAGDKRVLVVEGEIYGAFLRVATDGGWVNNITSGGTALAATVTPGEAEAVRATCAMYHERGIYTLGYDFLLGDSGAWMLSEINAGPNIGGYHWLERTSGVPVFPRLFDWLMNLASR